MRKSREEAAATRERIVDAAAREFRQNGIAETGLNDLMQAAGLTHGGFYKHFESKNQVVGEAVKRSFEQTLATMESSADGKTPRPHYRHWSRNIYRPTTGIASARPALCPPWVPTCAARTNIPATPRPKD